MGVFDGKQQISVVYEKDCGLSQETKNIINGNAEGFNSGNYSQKSFEGWIKNNLTKSTPIENGNVDPGKPDPQKPEGAQGKNQNSGGGQTGGNGGGSKSPEVIKISEPPNLPEVNTQVEASLSGIGLDPKATVSGEGDRNYVSLLDELKKNEIALKQGSICADNILLSKIYKQLGFDMGDPRLYAIYGDLVVAGTRAVMAYFGDGWQHGTVGLDSDVGPKMTNRILTLMQSLGEELAKETTGEKMILRDKLKEMQQQQIKWEIERRQEEKRDNTGGSSSSNSSLSNYNPYSNITYEDYKKAYELGGSQNLNGNEAGYYWSEGTLYPVIRERSDKEEILDTIGDSLIPFLSSSTGKHTYSGVPLTQEELDSAATEDVFVIMGLASLTKKILTNAGKTILGKFARTEMVEAVNHNAVSAVGKEAVKTWFQNAAKPGD